MEYLRDELIYFSEEKLFLHSNSNKIISRSDDINLKLEKAIKEIYPHSV